MNDSVTWAAIVTNKSKEMVLNQNPQFDYVATNHKAFYKGLEDGTIFISKPVPGAYSGMLVKPFTKTKAE